ncbi:alpha/beta-hydrolase [Apiospora marii]|uniref:Alpha/beta-hydrolase n=1 Tax=Apiospora marii TaxID=335849 RepID=A0ABR1R466_9PEZI
MDNAKPYKIAVPQSEIEALNQRLHTSKIPPLFEDKWERGPPTADIQTITKYWKDEFSWSAFENRLNQLPQYETTITLDGFESFQVHFIHQRSESKDAIPLLFGPAAFGVTKLLPILAQSEKDGGPAFHVVAPSLPNFGFSSRIESPGFGLRQYAETCHQLMQHLGYEQYASQGGDWVRKHDHSLHGLLPPRSPARDPPQHDLRRPPPPTSPLAFLRFLGTHFLGLYSEREKAGLKAGAEYMERGNGYYQIQKNRPNTIGVALADSPVGLLAWIYDCLVTWTDDYEWTPQEVCEWVSLYWFSRAGPAASVVIYHEATKGDWQARGGISAPGTKMGFSYFPKEVFGLPRFWNRRLGDVIFEREHDRGGHFPAWEQPQLLAGDLRVMFGRGGGAYGAVKAPST